VQRHDVGLAQQRIEVRALDAVTRELPGRDVGVGREQPSAPRLEQVRDAPAGAP
jgi:hypothetical protein